ncbi:DUF2867 domain-containing protein [Acidobacteria bacterium AH-259-D05]|nr:DUF2867 domain-containing protein [Acidobacteria bacterium AH-259-D05]
MDLTKRVFLTLLGGLTGIAIAFAGWRAHTTSHMRITADEFLRKNLRVHTFLADVTLHDVWILKLRGGGEGRTVRDLLSLFASSNLQETNLIVRSLFALRSGMGRMFGWDNEKYYVSSLSYAGRLTEIDRERSLGGPGSSTIGPFRLVYEFDNEALGEVINGTVHAFLLMAMEPEAHGYTVYWAIYVKKVNPLTPLYMALIDPFRRYLVYPAIIRKMEKAWVLAHAKNNENKGMM